MLLNVAGGICGLLIICSLGMAMLNGRLNQSVAATQNQFGQARQLQTTTENLVLSIAQAGKSDPVLRNLLVKHKINIGRNTNSPPQSAP